MGFLRSRRGPRGVAESMRDTLFGDLPLDAWPPDGDDRDEFPWTAFVEARAHLAAGSTDEAKRCWHAVVGHAGLEPRHYLQACHFLRAHGQRPPDEIAQDVLGVVMELGLPRGLTVVAVYADRSARYYHAAGGVVLDRAEGSLADRIDTLFAAAAATVAQIGPWEEDRPGPPARENVRLSFLTPSGLHFGEGGIEALQSDPLASRVLDGALDVMKELAALDSPEERQGGAVTSRRR